MNQAIIDYRDKSCRKAGFYMELTAMKNMGTVIVKKLNTIDVSSAEDFIRHGSKEAFFRLKAVYPELCLVHLYTLQGTIDNVELNMLPQELKSELKKFSHSLKSTN